MTLDTARVNVFFFIYQFVLSTAAFIAICHGYMRGKTKWEDYENFMGLVVSSSILDSTISIILQVYASLTSEEEAQLLTEYLLELHEDFQYKGSFTIIITTTIIIIITTTIIIIK